VDQILLFVLMFKKPEVRKPARDQQQQETFLIQGLNIKL
jgi:hypothetical protein